MEAGDRLRSAMSKLYNVEQAIVYDTAKRLEAVSERDERLIDLLTVIIAEIEELKQITNALLKEREQNT